MRSARQRQRDHRVLVRAELETAILLGLEHLEQAGLTHQPERVRRNATLAVRQVSAVSQHRHQRIRRRDNRRSSRRRGLRRRRFALGFRRNWTVHRSALSFSSFSAKPLLTRSGRPGWPQPALPQTLMSG